MSARQSDFDGLIAAQFPINEQRDTLLRVGYNFGPDEIKPISPNREDLLGYFDAFLLQFGVASTEEARDELEVEFLEKLGMIVDIAENATIKVARVASFAVETGREGNDGLLGWGVTAGKASVIGAFDGLWVGNWFDVEAAEQLKHAGSYFMSHGLLVALKGARLYYDDGGIDELAGTVYVPLNHGKPELYRVVPAGEL